MQQRMYYLPQWYFTFLRGYKFNPDEVHIQQSPDGQLAISIRGKWYSTIMWEMPVLSIISELMHQHRGDLERYDAALEYERATDKAKQILHGGLVLGDMGTRRRLSFHHHDNVIRALKATAEAGGENVDGVFVPWKGRIVGTSNVYLAMKYELVPMKKT